MVNPTHWCPKAGNWMLVFLVFFSVMISSFTIHSLLVKVLPLRSSEKTVGVVRVVAESQNTYSYCECGVLQRTFALCTGLLPCFPAPSNSKHTCRDGWGRDLSGRIWSGKYYFNEGYRKMILLWKLDPRSKMSWWSCTRLLPLHWEESVPKLLS